MAYDVTDFEADVLAASQERPVLVDFWAPWCGPCRVLGPTLERLADEADGRWTLAKVNTDEHPQLSSRYGIRGIPAVKLFSEGKVVDEFVGALPEHQVRQWLDAALPSEAKKRLEAARQALQQGDDAEAQALLEAVLEEEPEHEEAPLLLARAVAFREPDRALELADAAEPADAGLLQTRDAVRTVARLLHLHAHPDELPDEPGKEAYQQALAALARRDYDGALASFIEVVRHHRPYDDDGARRASVALFTLLGPQHEAVRRHRRTFDMALY